MKEFLPFQAATGKGKTKDKITAKSLNVFAEWFLVDFIRVGYSRRSKNSSKRGRADTTRHGR